MYIKPLLLSLGSLSFGFIRICFMVVFPLKCTCMPYLPHMCLILSAVPLVYGMAICSILALLVGLLLVVMMVSLLFFVVLLLSPLVLLKNSNNLWNSTLVLVED